MDPVEKFLIKHRHNPRTYNVYRSALNTFFKRIGLGPEELLKLSEDEIEYIVNSFINEMLREKSMNYCLVCLTAINGFLEANKVKVKVKRKNLKNIPERPDYIPTKEEILYILTKTRNELRAIIALMAWAGMRPIDVISLKFANVAEEIEYNEETKMYRPKKVPLKITIRQNKTKQWYVTFLGPRGAEILCNYLTELSRKPGRPLKYTDKLFHWHRVDALDWHLSRVLRDNLKTSPLRRVRPYILRKYFRRAALKLGEDVAEFLMGHVKGINSLSAVYSGLRDLDNRAIEELRKQYAKIVPELEGTTIEPLVSEELEKLKRRVKFLEDVLGVLTKLHPEDLEKVIRYAKLLQAKREYEEILEETNEEIEEIAMMTSQLASIQRTS